jgi:phosphoribosylformylglycinamidine cyclo-ligase
VADDEMARVFNLGLGMVMVVGPDSTGHALAALSATGVDAAVVGRVEDGAPGVEFAGPRWWPDQPGSDGTPGSDVPVPPA